MSLFEELKRRNVFRVAVAYVVTAWLLLQVADLVLENIGAPQWVMQSFMLLLAIGFPLAVVLSWVFELTPEGVKREHEVDRDRSITPQTGRRLNRMTIAVLGLLVAWFVFDEFYLEPREAASQPRVADSAEPVEAAKSIAVLPFADLSEAGDQEWFADGLAEEILNTLVRAPDLLVASRTSSFAYKGTTRPIPEIARELGVAHVLEGSVRRSDDRLRVTAQLIRAEDGFHVWSENYDRKTDDVIELQEELALSIARALETTMDPEALQQMLQAGTRSVEAYEEYLRGLSIYSRTIVRAEFQHLKQASEAFERAREIDPGFSDAHARAARIYRDELAVSRRGSTGRLGNLEEMMAGFRERIDQAIQTAPNPVDRQRHEALLALVEMRLRDAARLHRSVLNERPNDLVLVEDLHNVSVWTSDRDALQFATEHAWRHWERGPDWAEAFALGEWRIGGEFSNREQYVDRLTQIVQRYQTLGLAYQAHRTFLWANEIEKATRLFPRLADDEEGQPILTARQACAEGRRKDAEAALDMIPDEWSEYDKAAHSWHILMLLGREQEAVQVLKPLETATVPLTISAYLIYPHFDPTHFPVVMDVLEREAIDRPPAVQPPFACPPPEQTAVAVLPFVNMSGDEEHGYFSDGMTEEVINSLARIPDMHVAARTSVFAFKGTNRDIRQIGGELGVTHVVEGSVRSDGQQVRITAQLIKVDDGFHAWSDTYDRELVNVFEIQTEIANQIAGALIAEFSPEESADDGRPPTSIKAYDDYLRARAHYRARSDEDLDEALRLFTRSAEADPGFAPAWAGMAMVADVIDDHENAITWGEKALALDPNNVDALNAMAAVYRDTWRWSEAQALFERAVAIDPSSAELLEDYSEFLSSTGQVEEQLAVAEHGYEMDPFLFPMEQSYADALASNGQIERAKEIMDESARRVPLVWLHIARLTPYISDKDNQGVLRILRDPSMMYDPRVRELGIQAIENPEDMETRQQLRDMAYLGRPGAGEGWINAYMAYLVLLHLGESEFILDGLITNMGEAGSGTTEELFAPLYADVRRQPRFAELLDLVGLPEYWDEAGWPPACRRNEAAKIECH